MSILAVIGGQYGSEGKGAVVGAILNQYDIHVRAGGPNAGHTFYDADGHKFVMQSIPCGFANRKAICVIAPGCMVDLKQVLLEVEQIEEAGYTILDRLRIDANALIMLPSYKGQEGGVHGYGHETIGSTGKGVGIAQMARVGRRIAGWPLVDTAYLMRDLLSDEFAEMINTALGIDVSPLLSCILEDTHLYVAEMERNGSRVLLEGTQGSGLSNTTGAWPYVTSRDTNAAGLAAECGLPPNRVQTLLVFRTFPIRVAGPSGPMFAETTWEDLGFEPEVTTVTKKVRRVGFWDDGLARRSIMMNDPVAVAITFLDYIDPAVRGVTQWTELSDAARDWVRDFMITYGMPVWMVGTGPDTMASVPNAVYQMTRLK